MQQWYPFAKVAYKNRYAKRGVVRVDDMVIRYLIGLCSSKKKNKMVINK